MKWGVQLIRGLAVIGLLLTGIVSTVGVVSLTAGVAFAQSASSIIVEGNRRVEASTVRSYFKPGPGGQIGPQQIDEAYKALFATGLFQDVRINTVGGRIQVVLIENPVINRIAFEGNSKVKDEQLKTEVQSKERGTFSRPQVQNDTQRIIEIYRRSGRFDVSVNPKIIELANNRVDLVFEVNEGNKTGIKTIEFVGNRAYSGYRLKDVIKTSETGLLSFLQTTDIYDPDRIEADRELLRKFYLQHGYIDVNVVSAVGQFDPSRKGFVVTYTIDEGEQWRVGTVDVQSAVRAIDPGLLRGRLRVASGDVYNAVALEKSVEDMTIEGARQGFAFATVRPRADRNAQARLVNLTFVIDESQRAYIEQINIRGNTRTRDYVIRREFDLSEGDAFNRALISRAERRLNNLGYFKSVKITNEPGSSPDRVIVNVLVEETSTGEFSVAGGYSTTDGFLAEVSVGERNLLGRGQYAKASVQYGQHANGATISFVEPFFLGYRLSLGTDLFVRNQKATNFVSYDTKTEGGSIRLGFALREDLGFQLRYSLFRQEVSLPTNLQNCNNINPDFLNSFPTPNVVGSTAALTPPNPLPGGNLTGQTDCYIDGEASLAVRRELAQGPVITSMVGYTLNYNTLDNIRNPTSGLNIDFKQDIAGAGGDVRYLRSTFDVKNYYEVYADVVALIHLQAGHITGWDSKGLDGASVRMLDHFQMGPQLVRGFAPSGIGPRDITQTLFNGTPGDALGGTKFWGASLEFQTPLYFLPKDSGIKVAAFADAGSLWDYVGPTSWAVTGEQLQTSKLNCSNSPFKDDSCMFINASVGVGLLWASPFGPLRFDFALPLTEQKYTLSSGQKLTVDRKQWFRFGGGASF